MVRTYGHFYHSGGILWVHGMTRQLRIAIGVKFRRFCCCCRNLRNRAANIDVQRELIQQQNRRSAVANRRRKNAAEPAIAAEQPSDAGTFEGTRIISEVRMVRESVMKWAKQCSGQFEFRSRMKNFSSARNETVVQQVVVASNCRHFRNSDAHQYEHAE